MNVDLTNNSYPLRPQSLHSPSSVLRPPSTRQLPAAKKRPVIAVTGPDTGGEAAWLFTWLAVSLAGGSARWVTPHQPHRIDDFDGVIIGGGADVDPRLYGQELAPMLEATTESRRPLHLRILDTLLLPLTWLIRQLLARSS